MLNINSRPNPVYIQASGTAARLRRIVFMAEIVLRRPYPRKPIFVDPKLAKFGKTLASEASGMPNQDASVAPY